MKPQYFSCPFEIKSVGDDGVIKGYASVFGNVDLGFDVVDKGAFLKTIKESKGGKWPVLKDHNPSMKIGYNQVAKEDSYGLYIEEKLNLKTQAGMEEFELAKQALEMDAPAGLSIGYSTIKSEPDPSNGAIRRLKELKMWEHSHVTFPMNQSALVTAAKSWLETKPELGVKGLTDLFVKHMEEIGFGKDQIREALQKSAAAAKSMDPDMFIQSSNDIINILRSK